MPLFEFRCPKCGHKFEALMSAQRVKDAVCEKCGAPLNGFGKGNFRSIKAVAAAIARTAPVATRTRGDYGGREISHSRRHAPGGANRGERRQKRRRSHHSRRAAGLFPSVIENLPDIEDVHVLIEMLRALGARVEFNGSVMRVDPTTVDSYAPPAHLGAADGALPITWRLCCWGFLCARKYPCPAAATSAPAPSTKPSRV